MSEDELVDVMLLGLPPDVHRRALEHQDELQRELTLIELDPTSVPARLLALAHDLRVRFGAFTEAPSTELAGALARGDTSIDLRYRVPRAAGAAARELGQLLDEVDDFCRDGGMLTLATSEEGVAYRRWFLGQFVAQTAGAPPEPWSALVRGAASAEDS